MGMQTWIASVTYVTDSVSITAEQDAAIGHELPGFSLVDQKGDRARLEMTIEASTLRKATDEALKAAQAAWAAAFDVTGTPIAVEVRAEADHIRRIAHPSDLELISATEVAEMLGVSRQRVAELITSPDFPAPAGNPKSGKVWTRQSKIGRAHV